MAGINVEDRAAFTDPVRLPVVPEGSFLGPALQQVGAEMDRAGTQIYRAKQAGAILRAKTDLFADLRKAQLAAMDTPDPDTALKTYTDAASKAQAKVSQYGFDDYTRGRIALAFEHQNALTQMDVQHDAHAKVINRAQADLMAEFQQHIQGAANDPNVDKSDWQESFRHTLEIAKNGGIISPLKAQEMQTQYNRETDHSAALSLGYAAPGTAYQKLDEKTPDGNFANFKSLNPTDRAQLKEQVVNHSISMLRFQEAQEARREREADKQLKIEQGALAADFYAHLAAHDDPDINSKILASQNSLGPVQFEALLKASKGGAFGDDQPTYLKLKQQVYSGADATKDIIEAAQQGKITNATVSALMGENFDVQNRGGENRIKTGVEIGRAFVHTSMGIGGLFATFDQQRQIRAASAAAEYESWAQQNKGATSDVAMKTAKEMVSRWSRVAKFESSGALPRPTGISWVTDEKGNPKFDEMAIANAKLKETDLKTYTKNLEALGAQSRAWQQRQAEEAKNATGQ